MEENTMTPMEELDQVISTYGQQQDNSPAPASESEAPSAEETTVTETEKEEPAKTTQNPANAAFAQMRTENAKMNNVIKAFAQLNGYDANDLDSIAKALEEKVTAKEASEAQVPPEFMARFKQQEAMINAIMQQNAQNNLTTAFDSLKTAYGLSDEQTYNFAQELKNQNFNLQDLNKLGIYYKGLHFDELVEAKVAEALSQAANDNKYAAEHGATVNTKSGTLPGSDGGSGDDAADTMAAIMAGISELNKR